MAAGTSILSQISDDFLECQICLQSYRRPKVLSCLHTFCQECLELLIKRQEKQHELECPTCRTKTELPGSGVAALKDNFFVESLKDTVKLNKTAREMEGAGVTGISHPPDRAEGSQASHPALQAPRGLKFYCETCGEAGCRVCIILEHKDHSYTHLAKASAGIKEELTAALQDANKRMTGLKEKLQEILSKKFLLRDTVAQVQDEINAAAKQTRDHLKRLLDRVNAEQKDLLQKVQGIKKKTEKELCTVEDTLETVIVSLSSTTEFGRSIIAHGTDLEITSVKTEVQSRLQSLLELSPTEIRAPVGEPWVGFVAAGAIMIDDDVTLVGDVIEGDDMLVEACLVQWLAALPLELEAPGSIPAVSLIRHAKGHSPKDGTLKGSKRPSPRWGPSAQMVRLTWDNTTADRPDHDGQVMVNKGIQHFTVKCTGTYEIEAAGAAAGYEGSKSARGRGTLMKGTFQLRKGDILKILVGQEGAQNFTGTGMGGGGGTFVTREDNTPLIIAGGGSGWSSTEAFRNRTCDGTKQTTGNPSSGGKAGGKDGAGAVQGAGNDDDLGGGGGGLLTDGASRKSDVGRGG
ncbi:TRIM2 [Branchiostoma lanceolatum]|uniref:TRIM2 protein n=1 Tax=Branchiostoma lanceolatum TaxID=7740 RepID=A0A8J9YWI6_BRALA|nr:TRIM2 [Branchiostoma lanceolatum]